MKQYQAGIGQQKIGRKGNEIMENINNKRMRRKLLMLPQCNKNYLDGLYIKNEDD